MALAAALIASTYLMPMQYQVRFGQVGILLTALCLLDRTVKAPWVTRGVLIPFMMIPEETARFWFHVLLDSDRVGANNATTNQSLRGMLLRLYLDSGVTSVLWMILVAAVGVIGVSYGLSALVRAAGGRGGLHGRAADRAAFAGRVDPPLHLDHPHRRGAAGIRHVREATSGRGVDLACLHHPHPVPGRRRTGSAAHGGTGARTRKDPPGRPAW
ncbi:glycosyltransferase 87 family protein [Nonomuraea rosea]|uniref:glycosyltransferase 87 family protein n=1 Tax=Nonomuraea rosea TaxID=638574 RepID=UPI0031ED39B5